MILWSVPITESNEISLAKTLDLILVVTGVLVFVMVALFLVNVWFTCAVISE